MNIQGKIKTHHKLAIQYFADKLLSKQIQRFISLKVSFVKNSDVFGEVEISGYNTKEQPREFIIHLEKNIDNTEILKTLAHEMVHVKQYVYSELNEQMTLWRGKKVNETDWVYYYERPWEKEAEKLGNKLYNDFVKGKK